MCRNNVTPKAQEPLARLLAEMAAALEPDHPETVLIGPVDFGEEK
jgi:hypothetical protein